MDTNAPPVQDLDGAARNSPQFVNGGVNKASARTRRIERSCALCHRRKVRCDKKLPCATCTRMGVLCCYPSGSSAAPRKEKATISDIASRLAQLERTIVAISSDAPLKAEASGSGSSDADTSKWVEDHPESAAAPNRAPSDKAPFGMLVQNGNNDASHYVNEILLSRVLEEEREIQSVLATPRGYGPETPEGDGRTPSAPLSFGLLSLASYPRPRQADFGADASLHPRKWQAVRLLQVYVQNVDALSKIIHIPSAQVTIYAAIDDPENAAPDVRSLMFAIYFAAITTLTPEEVMNILEQEKVASLDQFRNGLEISLAAADILDRPSVMSLQALALYLQNARAHTMGRPLWVVNGVAIRLAQSLGLHRDPSRFGLPPFEVEMRRRLWWHIVTHDCRAQEDHGLDINCVDPSTDTQKPLCVDDSALDPAMTEPPVPPVGRFTDMTMATLLYETSSTVQTLYRLIPAVREHQGATAGESVRRETMDKLKARVAAHLSCCNPVIPLQRAVSLIISVMMRKLDFVSRQQWIYLGGTESESAEARLSEESLVDGCEILELNIELQMDELMRNYRWTGEIYPQYHVLLYILWHLRMKPFGPNAERAWKAIDATFALEAARRQRQDMGSGSGGDKWAVLEVLREKAWLLRRAIDPPSPGAGEAAGGTEDTLMGDGAPGWDKAFDDKLGLGWETGFLDWDGLVDGLNVHGSEPPGLD
ncbi:hypothetical protein GQ53DRAFT_813046 [Thozetella sp. PMI_491]|nr:hypothetical protein GQ53DRAFT_813046 [Thozetella sp. PMI_491]